MAIRAGDGVGMSAGDDVQNAGLVGHFAERERHRRIYIAQKERDLVAVDELVRFLHRDTGIGRGGILGDKLDLPSENAAFGVDLVDRKLAPDLFVAAKFGISPGERIVEPELDRLIGEAFDDIGTLRPASRRWRGRPSKVCAAAAGGRTNHFLTWGFSSSGVIPHARPSVTPVRPARHRAGARSKRAGTHHSRNGVPERSFHCGADCFETPQAYV